MRPPILVADDKGQCFAEVKAILADPGVEVVRANSMEDCILRLRKARASVLLVTATMKRAFSLLRIVRHSRDLRAVPLVVIAAPGQEELIEKHGQLPSRADRYLLQPLDPELLAGVIREFLYGGEAPPAPERTQDVLEDVPPPDANGLGPDKGAYQKIQTELRRSREKLQVLEADLHSALQGARQAADLREENEALRKRLGANEAQARSIRDYASIFERLESGYKETISDLERLVRDKDSLIADLRDQLPAADDIGVRARELSERLERQNDQISASRERAARVLDVLDRLRSQIEGLDLEALMRVAREAEEAAELTFSEEESTQVLDVASLKNLVVD